MRDGALRSGVKHVALLRYLFDLWITRLIRRLRHRPEYRLGGRCTACGACCETPMIQVHPVLFHLPSVRRAMISWHRVVNRFELVDWDREASAMVFRCLHFDPETRSCDSYTTRPGMCRDYPRPLLDAPDPVFLPGCTHHAVARNAAGMRAALAAAGLDEATRERIEHRLHLTE